MNESEFHLLADRWLAAAQDALEDADASGALDVEGEAGSLNIVLSSGQHFIVSKHAPTKQLWLSSPVSGGLHFAYDAGEWKLSDGRTLSCVLGSELKSLANIEAAL